MPVTRDTFLGWNLSGFRFCAAVLSHEALMLVMMPVHDQAIMNNVFAVFGLAGVINAQRELIIGFFGYNAAQVMGAMHAQATHACDSWLC